MVSATPCEERKNNRRILRSTLESNASKGNRFTDMGARNQIGAFEISDGASDPQNPVIAAGGQMQSLGCAQQELTALVVKNGDPIEQLAFRISVGAEFGMAKLRETLGLNISRSCDPIRNSGAAFAG